MWIYLILSLFLVASISVAIVSFVKLKQIEKKHIKDNLPMRFIEYMREQDEINKIETATKTKVVFFAWLNNEPSLAKEYMKMWKTFAIPQELHIVCTGNQIHYQTFSEFVKNELEIKSIEFFDENTFEHRGITKLWELAQQHDGPLVYFHNRGESRSRDFAPKNQKLMIKTFRNWPKAHKLLETYDLVSVITDVGVCWYNFFWCHGRFLKKVPKPKWSLDNRFYYETWLSEQKVVPKTFSLHFNDVKHVKSREAELISNKNDF